MHLCSTSLSSPLVVLTNIHDSYIKSINPTESLKWGVLDTTRQHVAYFNAARTSRRQPHSSCTWRGGSVIAGQRGTWVLVVMVVLGVYRTVQVAPERVHPDDLTRRLKRIKHKNVTSSRRLERLSKCSNVDGLQSCETETSAGERVRVEQCRAHASCAGAAVY